MGDALIIRSGGGNYSGGWIPKTELITQNQDYIVPEAKGQQFSIRIFGGGGYCGNHSGGGGGNMNNAVLTLNIGDIIPITIGRAGYYSLSENLNRNGGTTSFGTYLAATGGECGKENGIGGNGGTGGGAGGWNYKGGLAEHGNGGHGIYGGGGGGLIYYNCSGGNGGIYGGGGGGGGYSERDTDIGKPGISLGGWGNGGSGGNNINYKNDAENGFNTINLASKIDFVGCGLAGLNGGGGGGYGGNGGNGLKRNTSLGYYWGCGGGGGYGARGGHANASGGGGGGGYGGNGGNGNNQYGGGGGGYGLDQYGCGCGGEFNNAKPGVCIISYMQRVQS